MPRLPHGHFLTQSSMKSWWKGIRSADLPVKLELHMTWLRDDPVINHRNGMEWEIHGNPQTKWSFRNMFGVCSMKPCLMTGNHHSDTWLPQKIGRPPSCPRQMLREGECSPNLCFGTILSGGSPEGLEGFESCSWNGGRL